VLGAKMTQNKNLLNNNFIDKFIKKYNEIKEWIDPPWDPIEYEFETSWVKELNKKFKEMDKIIEDASK
jgi:hypothetical protein